MMSRIVNGARRNFGLVDRRHRLRFVGSRLFTQPNCGVFSAGICTIVVCTLLWSCRQFRAQRCEESQHRMLGGAIGRLQGNAAVSQRRSDMNDRPAVARQHTLQRR